MAFPPPSSLGLSVCWRGSPALKGKLVCGPEDFRSTLVYLVSYLPLLLLLGGNEDTGRRVLGAAVTVMRRPYLCPEGGSVCAEGRSLGTRQLGPMQLGHLGNGDSAVPPPRL